MANKKALVLDDQGINRSFIKAYLMGKSFDVTTAEDGLQGLELCKAQVFDLVYTDIEMPNMNGFEFLKAARRLPAYSKVPIVVLSTLKDDETLNRMKTLGATHYIVKPFTSDKMNEALKVAGFPV